MLNRGFAIAIAAAGLSFMQPAVGQEETDQRFGTVHAGREFYFGGILNSLRLALSIPRAR